MEKAQYREMQRVQNKTKGGKHMNSVGDKVNLLIGEEGSGVELVKVDTGSLAILNKSEIEQQVDTAKKYPRSIKRFRDEAMTMVTLTEKIAEDCIYAVPRGGKTIAGPSARFAEVIVSAWGNVRAGARIISEDEESVTAQGFFFDVERNVTIALEIKRRITDKYGRRYNADMIATTGNAAASIAFRNAVLKGVPKAFWADMYEAARQTAVGTIETLANKRAAMLLYFQKMGITQEMILATLELPGVEDIGMEELAVLKGMATALKEGESTPEQLFKMPEKPTPGKGTEALKEKLRGRPPKTVTPAEKEPPPEAPAGQALQEEAKKVLEKAVAEQVPFPEAKKAETSVANGNPDIVLSIAKILRSANSKHELDQTWKREVEGGTLEKIDKKKLMYVYQEVFERLNKD
jgi:hypothetical protein